MSTLRDLFCYSPLFSYWPARVTMAITLYKFVKDSNLSTTDSYPLIDRIGNYSPNIKKCWKTIERTVKEEMHVVDYYPI